MNTVSAVTYKNIDLAFGFFNEYFFNGELPGVVITLQRKKRAYGYYHHEKFSNKDGKRASEIALNPDHFGGRDDVYVLSTLLHEMCHLWQYTSGKPTRSGYHNKEFADIMEKCGLICSDTGLPGGKKTGQQMTHYIAEMGRFTLAIKTFKAKHVTEWTSLPDAPKETKKRTESKVKYTCPVCEQNAWAKPKASLFCGHCKKRMLANEENESEGA